MTRHRLVQLALTAVGSAGLLAQPARALINLDGGRNRINLNAAVSYGYDSNLFASNGGAGDTFANATVGVDLSRHAGLLGLDAGVGLSANRYGKFRSENFQNPQFHAEITKGSGRTTGSLSLSAARQSRADSAANLRNESWSYAGTLALNYRVIERYSIRPTFSYSFTDYTDNTIAVDLSSFSVGTDLYYILSATRDLLVSYRFRAEETSVKTQNHDHSVAIGLSGKIVSGFTGQVRAGYELRQPSGRGESSYRAWTANANVGWNLTRRFTVRTQVAKDFSTTSTNVSVDSLATTVSAQFVVNSKTSLGGGVTWSQSKFLGTTAAGRRDQNLSFTASLSRVLKRSNRGNVNGSINYVYSTNSSTESLADFNRTLLTANVSTSF